jgi:hypothetical protein
MIPTNLKDAERRATHAGHCRICAFWSEDCSYDNPKAISMCKACQVVLQNNTSNYTMTVTRDGQAIVRHKV